MEARDCGGRHYIYVAEVIYVQAEGKVFVIDVCRACGEVTFHEKTITRPGNAATFLKDKQKEKIDEL